MSPEGMSDPLVIGNFQRGRTYYLSQSALLDFPSFGIFKGLLREIRSTLTRSETIGLSPQR
jgi:hypothetical protein